MELMTASFARLMPLAAISGILQAVLQSVDSRLWEHKHQ